MQGGVIVTIPKNDSKNNILFKKIPELKQIFDFEWKEKEDILGVKFTELAPQIDWLWLSVNVILNHKLEVVFKKNLFI